MLPDSRANDRVASAGKAALPQTAAGESFPVPGSGVIWEQLGRRFGGEQGLLGEMCRHALGVPGKMFRPTLLLQSAAAVGGTLAHVLPAAIGTEIGHIASLVHDDIIDDDSLRRGQPTVHVKFGADNAIVAGDMLFFDLFRCLAECRKSGAEDSRIVSALEVVAQAGIDLCRGQSLEAELTASAKRDVGLYELMIKLKTGALFSGACQAGAVLGGGGREEVESLGRYGDELGIAFQMSDDLLTYVGQSNESVGKSLVSDIRNKRMTLPVILACGSAGPADRELLDHALGGEQEPEAALAALRGVMERSGALQQSRDLALTHARRAIDSLSALRTSPSRDQLAQYASRAIDRIC